MKGELHFAYPGRLDTNTGGYAYDRRIIEGLTAAGWTVTPMALGDGFPFPDASTRAGAEERLSRLPDGASVLIDGLAFGVLDDWATREAARLTIVALVHHPLALETGLSPAQQAAFATSERIALAATRHVIVTSAFTARQLTEFYGVAPTALTVALPGTQPAPMSPGNGVPPHILSIGSLIRRKGHDVLIAALAAISDRPWTATIIGSPDLDPDTARALERQIVATGLQDRIALAGEIADTRGVMAGADIFALASRYEGYGMVFAEALSQGVPIVACHTGAVPDVVPPEAGILVPPDDAPAFANALRRLVTDPAERRQKATAAASVGARLPQWHDTAGLVSDCLERLT